jgi:F420-dependent oxidoreductase-like protein
VKIGLQIIEFDWPGGPPALATALRDVAVAAEDAGYSSLWLMDHFFQMPGFGAGPDDPMLECYTGLAYLAAHTSRIELGPLVSCVAYRHPGVLLKTATTLDVLSGGRAWLGIGAGWYDEEAVGLGLPWPPLAERYRLLEDTLRLAHHTWRDGNRAAFKGSIVDAPEPVLSPAPLRPGGPRILIGGTGERKTLRLLARYGDASNLWVGRSPERWFDSGPADVRRWISVIERHCAEVGRDPGAIEHTAHATVESGRCTDDDLRRLRDELAGIGVGYLVVNLLPGSDLDRIRRVAAAVLS